MHVYIHPHAHTRTGISNLYLDAITFVWSVVDDLPPPSMVMGPFGGEGNTVFNETPPAATAGAQLSGIRFYSLEGYTVAAMQVRRAGIRKLSTSYPLFAPGFLV